MSENGFFVHEKGLCETTRVGKGTRIWAFAHILPGARLGADCNVCDGVFIENDVVVGDSVTIKCGVQLWDGVRLGDRVFVGPNATFTNDKRPRSKQYPERFAETIVEQDASIGANATILPGVRIGQGTMVGAGSVVTKDVPPYAVVIGNPAVITGYQSETYAAFTEPAIAPMPRLGEKSGDRLPLGVGGCELWRLPHFSDMRGLLTPLEFDRDLPFAPKRSFLVFGVPNNKVRGEHAHRECHQFLIAVAGELSVVVDNGSRRCEVELTDPTIGLHMPPMVWGIQYKFRPGTALLVYASHAYAKDDYLRDYAAYRRLMLDQAESPS